MPIRPSLRSVLGRHVLVADGAMGTMLQHYSLSNRDFGGYEGCNEILNITRPDVVASIHTQYLDAGADMIETNTFGANLTALTEYGLAARIDDVAEMGAKIARAVADQVATDARPRWVLGSVGPGTKLVTLGQTEYETLRDAYQIQVAAMIRGGIDAVQIETCQDLLGIRAAVAGAKKAISEVGVDIPVFVSVTVEATGTLLVGSDLGAVIATLEPLGVDILGLNCATGPDLMGPSLRQLASSSAMRVSCMPNAGLPVLINGGAVYPLSPGDFGEKMSNYVTQYNLSLVGGCCGTTPEHIRALIEALGDVRNQPVAPPDTPQGSTGSVASLYSAQSLSQDVSYLSIGERLNASGSRAFRQAMLAGKWDVCVDMARSQVNQGAHVLDLCVDYVGRDGRSDMAQVASRIAREVDIPLMIDSGDPEVIRVGLEHAPGRSIVNSVHFESGDAPESKFAQCMDIIREHGAAVVGLCIDEEGQARTVERKLAVAERLIATLTTRYAMGIQDIFIDCLTFPIGTGQEDVKADAANTIEAIYLLRRRYPELHLSLGISNVSFGLNPSARAVLNSVFLHESQRAGLDAAIVHPSKIMPIASIPRQQVVAALDLVWNRRPDALESYLALFEGVTVEEVLDEGESSSVEERLRRHIIDGSTLGLEDDLREAMQVKPPVEIINNDLLDAMREVGERFGDGRMQLPFVLKSAEAMKTAVTMLEPYLDRSDVGDRGTIVLATVRGDVHDIGKNLVDIILSNNGYHVVNLGIKQPIADIITAAESVGADAIGMSGLLVKSTQVMKENLEELEARGLGTKYPVLLGGAALTRAFVEDDLDPMYSGEVRYAKDAFEGLTLMDAIMKAKDNHEPLPDPQGHRTAAIQVAKRNPVQRSAVTRPIPGGVGVPEPPFWGARRGSASLDEVCQWLDERALFAGQWGLKAGPDGPSYEELVEDEGYPRLAAWLDIASEDDLFDFQVVWGYWPCHSEGNDLVIEPIDDHEEAHGHLISRATRFIFPRQSTGEGLCLADYFRDTSEAQLYGPDVVAFQLVTVGSRVGARASGLFASNKYREYFELHGLSVQLTEAFAEMWHARVRKELHLSELTLDRMEMVRRQKYQGERFSFGYPACPDLTQRRLLLPLLQPERIGVTLSESDQLSPEQSTDAMIVHHPEAHYFSVR